MKTVGLGPVLACLLLGFGLVYVGGNGRAHARPPIDDTVEVRGGLLTVSIDASPISTVLEIIGRHSGVTIRSHAPIDGSLTARFRDVPLDEGVARILEGRSVVFIYSGDFAGDQPPRLIEVHIYSGSGSRPDVARSPQRSFPDVRVGQASDSGSDATLVRAWRDGDDQAVRYLSQVLAHEQEPSTRARAAKVLGRIGGDDAINHLAASIATDPDAGVREAAAAGLGRTWSERAVAPLAQALLDNQQFFVREAAARALGETWSPAAVNALASALSTDPRQSVRETAAEALGKIGGSGAVGVLVAALADAHSTVRESAAAALGAIGGPEVLDALIQISLTDADSWVRRSAERSAANIRKLQ